MRQVIQDVENQQTRMWKTNKQACGKPANKHVEKPHAIKEHEITSETTSETTHNTQQGASAPVGVSESSANGKTRSRYTLQECRRYAESLKAAGITNPGGYATTIYRSGEADSLIEEFLNPARAPDPATCPDCKGQIWIYPLGIGNGPGVKKCNHEKLKGISP